MKNKLPMVHITTHKNFFEKVFEPKRRQLQKQLGLSNLSQVQFTAMIKDIKLNIKIKPIKRQIVTRKSLRGII